MNALDQFSIHLCYNFRNILPHSSKYIEDNTEISKTEPKLSTNISWWKYSIILIILNGWRNNRVQRSCTPGSDPWKILSLIHQSQFKVRFYPRASWACERHNASLDCRAWRGSSPNTNTWDANTMQRLCLHHHHPHHLNHHPHRRCHHHHRHHLNHHHHHHHWRSQVVKEGTRVSFHTGTEQEQGTGRGMILD